MSDSPELINLVEEIWNPSKSCLLCVEDQAIIIRRTDILYHLARHRNYGWDSTSKWLKSNVQVFGCWSNLYIEFARYYLGDRSVKETQVSDSVFLISHIQQSTDLLRTRWTDLVYQ